MTQELPLLTVSLRLKKHSGGATVSKNMQSTSPRQLRADTPVSFFAATVGEQGRGVTARI
jgi:hypothetical protein